MIDIVTLQSSTYAKSPSRFEAGTPPIAEAIGMGEACEYLTGIGMELIYAHEKELGQYLYNELEKIDSLVLYGPKKNRTGFYYIFINNNFILQISIYVLVVIMLLVIN